MKNTIKILTIMLTITLLASCSREKFADLNTDPDAILNIPPEYELPTGLLSAFKGSQQYYDLYLGIYYWSQTFTISTGNTEGSYQATGNIGARWGVFYDGIGNRLVDIKEIIKKLPADKQASYTHLNAIVDISLAYYAWYTSDVYNSIPYSEAFRARYTTPPLLTPKYDTQEQLYALLETQLKAAKEKLNNTPAATQANLKGYDIYFQGDAAKWIKTANSLRLKIAMRMMKRNPEKLRAIAAEVLGDPAGVISNDSESWKFIAAKGFTNVGDNPANQRPVSGSKNMVDFMWKTSDPRIRIYYMPSHFNKERFEAAQAQGKIPANFVWDGQLYRGQYISPDASLDPAKSTYFTAINYTINNQPVNGARLPSSIRASYFNCEPNDGNMTYPLINYSDVLFMRAELAQRNIYGSPAEAQDFYYKGIEAALSEHDMAATTAKIPGYQTLTPEEVAKYKASPGIIYDPTNALEQICIQQYINYFKNINEAWALVKRTGFPSITGKLMKYEDFISSGVNLQMPRRFSIARPFVTNLNAQNINNAIDEMTKDPDFGSPNDITGRVWWDMK
ncbi:Susd and RagB outer membrane lipoprotein [Sphingobacterium spiritivorum]|uniref:Susd and RagB outer membrane lipoprotein n=1 Tax=Sphingobacterium spiritivorum TaxID=258 RepID=A0A380BWF8_SPHSI|nr:SusD/RagB family nutrient-binding outer membrane lipoprotein [Sphingobacterium spiritivorum]SUJ07773.1 Susd and RagB outer membrane lipoprotein [Sphingobacterium spiritivorum]